MPRLRTIIIATTALATGISSGGAGLAQSPSLFGTGVLPACEGGRDASPIGLRLSDILDRLDGMTPEEFAAAAAKGEVCVTASGSIRRISATEAQTGASGAFGAAAGADIGADKPAALAAGADGARPTEVTETTVTEENSRSSSEDFETEADRKARQKAERQAERKAERKAEREAEKARQKAETEAQRKARKQAEARAAAEAEAEARAQAQAQAQADAQARLQQQARKDKGGLSGFEKFALGAAGIVVLSQILGKDAEVVENTGDRLVVREGDGSLRVLRDDDTILRRPGSEVRTETFSDGSTRTIVTRPNGAQIVTIADATGRVIQRTRITPDGRHVVLIDDTGDVAPVDVSTLPREASEERRVIRATDREALRAALAAEVAGDVDRHFTLEQVRRLRPVRMLMPEISVESINFRTNSAAIDPEEADDLLELGQAMAEFIAENPDEIFLIEGHTDAVGDAAYNLALSDRRAESVALALTEYFGVPPENMVIQGYGESDLLVPTDGPERANRRVAVRRITPLLR